MIKLNNKNITYVALADSSNSLKAPKEIWYADSNNSVKLVYRRKDALIEGDDYEKYHWVKGDGSAYIDTLVSDLTNVRNIYCKIKRPSDVSGISNQRVFGRENSSGYSGTRFVVRPYDNHLDLYTSTVSYTLLTDDDDYINIDAESNTASTSQQSKTVEDIKMNGISLGLFADHGVNLNFGAIYKGSIGEFTIGESMKLIPCKLLKPVPKWLDANGIRRQVGECGMIDIVSGKFYGNVNSVGTFTVENYYERKEWLVGDGTAYIDTLHSASEDLDWVTKVGNLTDGKALFWDRDGNGYAANMNVMIARTNDYRIGVRIANNSSEILLNPFPSSFTVQTNGEAITIDGQSYSVIKNAGFNRNIKLFHTLSFADTNDVKCAYFRFLDSNRNYIQNLIPCTLTMDLPASMDANNIARTKGTSGMWDLVSDRFYGNVANSGTFKAVNLAEGVDYEVHQWLKGDGTAYIDTGLHVVETDVVSIKFVTISLPSTYYIIYGDNSGTYTNTSLIITSAAGLIVRPTGSSSSYMEYISTDTAYEVKQSMTSVEIDRQQVWQGSSIFESSTVTCRLFSSGNSSNLQFPGKIAYFSISDRMNLIPVKLLRSIPSKYDANGRARNAGECGMYDTVNDVFYGNVANSGSFTVEDDS